MATSAAPPIPSPPRVPFFGSAFALDPQALVQSLVRLSKQLGPIYFLQVLDERMLLLGSYELIHDACDTKRFVKALHRPLMELRAVALDGLFTAHNEEENWGRAHRVLMPAFAPAAMRDYFSDMLDIAEQMFLKWERLGPQAPIDVTDNMTRLTLDTIALCGMGYRFNSFYSDGLHPFVHAMTGTLLEAQLRGGRLAVQTALAVGLRRRFDADRALMYGITEQLIAQHRSRAAAPPGRQGTRHLLGLMLEQPDPQTGTLLDIENVQRQLITFLIAGHETTSGMLSFATHLLLAHPHVLGRARTLVDEVFGDETPRFEHLARLGYIEQILKETLRLHPTAAAFAVSNPAPTTLANTYPVPADTKFIILLDRLHRDPAVWPEPDRFDPDRFAPERRDRIPPHAWMPFGNGVRACIGRVFTLQEATLVLAMMLHRFELAHVAPYTLRVKETLTVKPVGLVVHARRRPRPAARPRPTVATAPPRRGRALNAAAAAEPTEGRHGTPLVVAFGSNSGTAEALARRVAADGAGHGYSCRVLSLDAAAAAGGTDPLVAICASYNGEPPDNAAVGVAWAAALPPGSQAGRPLAIFGCGDRNWASTYQAVPRRLSAALEAAGGVAALPRGEGNAAGDLFADFERWYAELWPALGRRLGITSALAAGSLYWIDEAPPGSVPVALGRPEAVATVLENRELVDMGWPHARSKRHLTLRLPPATAYQPGDYLAIWPQNVPEQVARAAALFGLDAAEVVVLRSQRGAMAASLPVDVPLQVGTLLATCVELGSPLTAPELGRLAPHCRDPAKRAHLDAVAVDPVAFRDEVGQGRLSVLDVLEAYPSVALSFAEFLEFLPPMRARQYSISSSPRRLPEVCSLTVAVVDGPAPQGIGRFRGAASNYLAGLAAGGPLPVAVRQPNAPFRPPADNARPLLMAAAGSGVAPLRAFIEDRVLRAAAGEAAGPMVLYFGCDHPEVDFLYRDELRALEAAGRLVLRPAFSRRPALGCRYVQDRMWRERAEILAWLAAQPLILVCGSAQTLAAGVVDVLARIHAEAHDGDLGAGRAWVEACQARQQMVLDVFG